MVSFPISHFGKNYRFQQYLFIPSLLRVIYLFIHNHESVFNFTKFLCASIGDRSAVINDFLLSIFFKLTSSQRAFA